jgi:hypothetical protein
LIAVEYWQQFHVGNIPHIPQLSNISQHHCDIRAELVSARVGAVYSAVGVGGAGADGVMEPRNTLNTRKGLNSSSL